MFKRIASFCLLLVLALTSASTEARTKNGKKIKNKKRGHRSSKIYKTSKNKRKSKRFKYGTGPDLKTITTESHYTEETNNGVNSIETKQPGI